VFLLYCKILIFFDLFSSYVTVQYWGEPPRPGTAQVSNVPIVVLIFRWQKASQSLQK
jgi:hypothetical protein